MSTIAASAAPVRDPFGRVGPLVATAHAPVQLGPLVRRLLIVLVSTVVLTGGAIWVTQSRSVAVADAAPAIQVVVQPGDTIWQLAAAHRPAHIGTQDYAMVIVLHNEVTATALVPGSVLELPQAAR